VFKKQASKIFSTKTQECSPFSGNNQAFYSIADFSFHFTTVIERKVPFSKEKSNVSSCGSKMISLQVFPRIGAVRTRGADGKIRTVEARVMCQSD